ncbi:MAG: hypothetical protein KKA60_11735, partial [Proteobacteria bacterium]|nr:hypothetical protein [Pseudomonadota bacterium]
LVGVFFMWIMASTGPAEQMDVGATAQEISAWNQEAQESARNARMAAQVFFLEKPNATLTRKDLFDNGLVLKPDILIFLDNGLASDLAIRTAHRRGSKAFIVDSNFEIRADSLDENEPGG